MKGGTIISLTCRTVFVMSDKKDCEQTSPLVHTFLGYMIKPCSLCLFLVTVPHVLVYYTISSEITISRWMCALWIPSSLHFPASMVHSWTACEDDLTVILWGDPSLTPSRMSVPGNLQYIYPVGFLATRWHMYVFFCVIYAAR